MNRTIANFFILLLSVFLLTACESSFANLGRLVLGIIGLAGGYFVHQLVSGSKGETTRGIVAGLATAIGIIVLAAVLSEVAASIVAALAIIGVIVAVIAYFRK